MQHLDPLPEKLRHKVRRELRPAERIEWVGQPVPRCFTRVSAPMFLFGIVFTSFSIFWVAGAWGYQPPDFSAGGTGFFGLFGIPFILVGCGMLASPLWTRRKAIDTVYLVTDQRAILIEGIFSTTVRSFMPDQLGSVYRRERRGGLGDVVFKKEVSHDSEGGRTTTDIGFLNIRDPAGVERLVSNLADKAAPEGRHG